jgi:hypothetical protein
VTLSKAGLKIGCTGLTTSLKRSVNRIPVHLPILLPINSSFFGRTKMRKVGELGSQLMGSHQNFRTILSIEV